MTRPATVTLLLATFLGASSCANYFHDRLLFIEETHLGLIARVSPDETAPADIDFGYRRTILTLTPQKNTDIRKSPDAQRDDNNGEIMSVISAFSARVGWFESTAIRSYFATGDAATSIGDDAGKINALTSVPQK